MLDPAAQRAVLHGILRICFQLFLLIFNSHARGKRGQGKTKKRNYFSKMLKFTMLTRCPANDNFHVYCKVPVYGIQMSVLLKIHRRKGKEGI